MKRIFKITFYLPILLLPILSYGAGLIPNCGTYPSSNGTGTVCEWRIAEVIALVGNIINFAIIDLAIPIAAIMFAYAGFLLITSNSGEGKARAKNIFTNTVMGIIFAAGAWIIVKALLMVAGYTDVGTYF